MSKSKLEVAREKLRFKPTCLQSHAKLAPHLKGLGAGLARGMNTSGAKWHHELLGHFRSDFC